MSEQALTELEEFEREQRIARQLSQIPKGVLKLELADAIKHAENIETLQRKVRGKERQAKSIIDREAYKCYHDKLQEYKINWIKLAEEKQRKLETSSPRTKRSKKGGNKKKKKIGTKVYKKKVN